MTSFPNRVWEPTANGWATRVATDDDHKRRRVISELVHCRDPKRRDELHNLLAQIQKTNP